MKYLLLVGINCTAFILLSFTGKAQYNYPEGIKPAPQNIELEKPTFLPAEKPKMAAQAITMETDAGNVLKPANFKNTDKHKAVVNESPAVPLENKNNPVPPVNPVKKVS